MDLNLLVADDSIQDKKLLKEAIREAGIKCKLSEVSNGVELLKYLHSALASKHNFPDLILLDLNMPLKDGRVALKEIKSTEKLKNTLTIILSTSSSTKDVEICYELGANLYLVKPHSFIGNVEMMTLIHKLTNDFLVLPSQN